MTTLHRRVVFVYYAQTRSLNFQYYSLSLPPLHGLHLMILTSIREQLQRSMTRC